MEKEKALALQRELEKAAREKEMKDLEEKRKALEERRKLVREYLSELCFYFEIKVVFIEGFVSLGVYQLL